MRGPYMRRSSNGSDVSISSPSKTVSMSSLTESLSLKTTIKRSKNNISELTRKSSRVLLNQRICYVSEEMLADNFIDIKSKEDLEVFYFQSIFLKLVQIAINILKKNSKLRFEEELKFLYLALQKQKFFAGLQKQMEFDKFLRLFRELQIEEMKAGDRVVTFG